MWRAFAGIAVMLLAACASRDDSSIKSPVQFSTTSPRIALDERRALFAEMSALVRRFHVFSDHTRQNLGRRWEDDLPALRLEFESAEDLEQLRPALHHFVNALHDAHCRYRPRFPGRDLRLGFGLAPEWIGDQARFYVTDIQSDALRSRMAEGDVVVEADETPAATLLKAHALVSNRNNWRGIALDVARFLTARREDESAARVGTQAHFVLERPTTGQRYELSINWKGEERTQEWGSPQNDTGLCGPYPSKDYGAYELAARGARYCFYTSKIEPYRRYPIVRQFAFDYSSDPYREQIVRADHDTLESLLSRESEAQGIVLDLRENRGGNDSNTFLDWWAPRAYVDTWTISRLDAELGSAEALARFETGIDGPHAKFYIQSLSLLKEGKRFSPPRPFMCRAATCDANNTYVPSHQVTRLPVTLLVGPGCSSSCDAFVFHFNESKFGPLVGEPPVSGLTTHRIREPIPSHEDLGTFDMALTYDVSGETGEALEGLLRTVDYPVARTRENYRRYDRLVVDTAIRAFHEFRF